MTIAPGYLTEKHAVLTRLRRVEGQVRGLQRLVSEETCCVEILTRLTEANQAIARLVRS